MPLWRNWQTHLTQNQAVNNRAGSSPASGIAKKDLQKRTLMQIFFYCLPFKKTAFERKKTPFEEPAICRMVLFERGFTVVISYLFPNIFSYSGVPSSVAK